jgi:hypothetical protein
MVLMVVMVVTVSSLVFLSLPSLSSLWLVCGCFFRQCCALRALKYFRGQSSCLLAPYLPFCCTLVPLLQNPPTPQLSLRILKLSRISAQNRTDSNFCAGQKCARIFYSVFTHHKIEKRPPCCLENLEDMHVLKNCIQNSKESHFLQSRTGTKHVLPTCEGTKNANCQLL